MRRVVIHIDRLVLNGFRLEDRHAIAEGLQQELSRQLADPQIAQRVLQCGDTPRLQVGRMNFAQDLKPQAIGVGVAQGIGKAFR